ncbi:hypothetical protein MPTK1_7g10750 [Marchantia polymorpha subsp. ruderalis]|uniref:Uncharacterized protein n=2 Tax=Marchantia polymorpha TaxID=3197 RepID=A0AAF6BY73_MARPO|nr:hypothetical protein MARPO_0003s0090 [Marchantia polymorpha]PTQ49194.1 hypothetical protein MARPO_0003s0090 [Marchantia polymorpha]BBN16956.1 hypothetical protein Mp_7g10750 [Marchantia polymorpha subsp. ruderalis]BBN16957.1 hypothetical protein Mp_7g10750 [Marchantia polymorpha subsp. ruderalis]|eukprot:PTQ49193.1 hypothetical protein MARPO_0003s0090 [Marchantia polymorpha]
MRVKLALCASRSMHPSVRVYDPLQTPLTGLSSPLLSSDLVGPTRALNCSPQLAPQVWRPFLSLCCSPWNSSGVDHRSVSLLCSHQSPSARQNGIYRNFS